MGVASGHVKMAGVPWLVGSGVYRRDGEGEEEPSLVLVTSRVVLYDLWYAGVVSLRDMNGHVDAVEAVFPSGTLQAGAHAVVDFLIWLWHVNVWRDELFHAMMVGIFQSRDLVMDEGEREILSSVRNFAVACTQDGTERLADLYDVRDIVRLLRAPLRPAWYTSPGVYILTNLRGWVFPQQLEVGTTRFVAYEVGGSVVCVVPGDGIDVPFRMSGNRGCVIGKFETGDAYSVVSTVIARDGPGGHVNDWVDFRRACEDLLAVGLCGRFRGVVEHGLELPGVVGALVSGAEREAMWAGAALDRDVEERLGFPGRLLNQAWRVVGAAHRGNEATLRRVLPAQLLGDVNYYVTMSGMYVARLDT